MSTVAVELPQAWDDLMEELGYQPLRSFYLEPIDDEGIDPMTSVEEIPVAPATPTAEVKSKVHYYNLSGHESEYPFNGLNIEVTTNSDNTRSAKKTLKVKH